MKGLVRKTRLDFNQKKVKVERSVAQFCSRATFGRLLWPSMAFSSAKISRSRPARRALRSFSLSVACFEQESLHLLHLCCISASACLLELLSPHLHQPLFRWFQLLKFTAILQGSLHCLVHGGFPLSWWKKQPRKMTREETTSIIWVPHDPTVCSFGGAASPKTRTQDYLAMNQHPNRTPSEHPIQSNH